MSLLLAASASAPGKLILFGEHAVVYGHTAIAAAISDMRVSVDAQLVLGEQVLCISLLDIPSSKTCYPPLTFRVELSELRTVLGGIAPLPHWTRPAQPEQAAIQALSTLLEDVHEEDLPALLPVLYLAAGIMPQLLHPSWTGGLNLQATSCMAHSRAVLRASMHFPEAQHA
eukprot:1667479-Pleurochrysis_carterae.AAC.1